MAWDKEQRQTAKKTGQALMLVDIDGVNPKSLTGHYKQSGPISEESARAVFFFACALWDGKSLAEAYHTAQVAVKSLKQFKEENPLNGNRTA